MALPKIGRMRKNVLEDQFDLMLKMVFISIFYVNWCEFCDIKKDFAWFSLTLKNPVIHVEGGPTVWN